MNADLNHVMNVCDTFKTTVLDNRESSRRLDDDLPPESQPFFAQLVAPGLSDNPSVLEELSFVRGKVNDGNGRRQMFRLSDGTYADFQPLEADLRPWLDPMLWYQRQRHL
jgi:hypothetical protein